MRWGVRASEPQGSYDMPCSEKLGSKIIATCLLDTGASLLYVTDNIVWGYFTSKKQHTKILGAFPIIPLNFTHVPSDVPWVGGERMWN